MKKFTETVVIPRKTDKEMILGAYEEDMDCIFRRNGIECDKKSFLNKKVEGRVIDGKFQSSVKPTAESVRKSLCEIYDKYNVKATYNNKTGEITIKGKY